MDGVGGDSHGRRSSRGSRAEEHCMGPRRANDHRLFPLVSSRLRRTGQVRGTRSGVYGNLERVRCRVLGGQATHGWRLVGDSCEMVGRRRPSSATRGLVGIRRSHSGTAPGKESVDGGDSPGDMLIMFIVRSNRQHRAPNMIAFVPLQNAEVVILARSLQNDVSGKGYPAILERGLL